MLCVPEEVIKRAEEKLFSYLWQIKKDKIKRTLLYQTPCRGGLNFPNVGTTVKALRLSWIGRLLSESNDAWKAIPNAYFNRYGLRIIVSLEMQLQHKKIRQHAIFPLFT